LSAAYAERWRVMADMLHRYLPDCRQPSSFMGSSCWISGPSWLNADVLAVEARAEGVLIEPGSIHFSGPDIEYNHFRLGFSAITAERIPEGIAALARAVDRLRPLHGLC
jgi:GntR family transcriptional regulator / MocR family aminotransferase